MFSLMDNVDKVDAMVFAILCQYEVKTMYGDSLSKFRLQELRSGNVELNVIRLETKCQNSGIGSKILTFICDRAELSKIDIEVTPDGLYGSSVSRLTKWYRKFGFVKHSVKRKGYYIDNVMIKYATTKEKV